jgi:ABC-2 type transport system permease protein
VDQAFLKAETVRAGSAAEVQAAFGPNGAKIKSAYAVGMSLPGNLDSSLRSGTTPSLSLYLNGTMVNTQTQELLQIAIVNFTRAIASPQSPVTINTTVINPLSTQNAGAILKQVYSPLALLVSLMVSTTFIPLLLPGEKEKKMLRMPLITPASFGDILVGKLLVVLVFQLAMTSVVLAILGDFPGAAPLVVLYVLIGACLSLSLCLSFSSLFNSVQSAGTVAGLVSIVYIVSGIFVGPPGELLSNRTVLQIARFIPTYYLADGIFNASQNLGTLGSNFFDISIIRVSPVVFLAISAWALRRQSSVLAKI